VMNSISGLVLAWFLRDVQRCSEESLRTKVKEEKKWHAVLISVPFIVDCGERSGGACHRLTFGARRYFERLSRLNGKIIPWIDSPLNNQ
jgi:hypothetical protein